MILRLFLAFTLAALVTGCDERNEVVVTEARALTTRDLKVRLGATSDERFRNTRSSPVEGEAPAHWLSLPATEFRLQNYRFGESGLGEVWVSVASGGVLDNVNRWLRQFGDEAVDEQGLQQMRHVTMLGLSGVWVEAVGVYSPGMMAGGQPRSGYALAGVIAEMGDQLLTVKMVGPEAEVKAATDDLEAFVASLNLKQENSK